MKNKEVIMDLEKFINEAMEFSAEDIKDMNQGNILDDTGMRRRRLISFDEVESMVDDIFQEELLKDPIVYDFKPIIYDSNKKYCDINLIKVRKQDDFELITREVKRAVEEELFKAITKTIGDMNERLSKKIDL